MGGSLAGEAASREWQPRTGSRAPSACSVAHGGRSVTTNPGQTGQRQAAETPGGGAAWFRDLVAGAPDGVLVVAGDGQVVYANAEAERLFGYAPGELVGIGVDTLVPPDARSAHSAHRLSYASQPRTRLMGSGLDLMACRRDGTTFPVDVSLSPLEAGGDSWVTAFVRDVSEAKRSAARSSAIAELTQALLRGTPRSEVLELIAAHARSLADATICWVIGDMRDGGPRVLAASGEAASGEAASDLVGMRVSPASPAAAAVSSDDPVLSSDLSGEGDEGRALPGPWQGLGAALYAPLRAEEHPFAVLCVARRWGAEAFGKADADVLRRFADQAALALQYAELRSDLEQLTLAADRERIARDLHDTVIQSLFATGMGLQAVLRLVQAAPEVRDRIERSIDDLDAVVRGIRSTIFELRPAGDTAIRQKVLDVASEAAGSLGFVPRVRFEGPLDVMVPEDASAELLPTLREALSNVARHACAGLAEVLLVAGEDLVLEVSDDGVGPGRSGVAGSGTGAPGPAELSRDAGRDTQEAGGQGLANMQARASRLGGTCVLEARPGGGAVLRWSVPLGR